MKTAWLFPGQGAQAPGMGRELADAYPECRALFDRASAVLGCDLARLCFEGPEEELTRSDRAQPAIFTVSAAALFVYLDRVPGATAPSAGLSSGEWAALYAAGVIGFEDTVRVLAARGRLMQEACEARPGAMVSIIGLDRPALEAVCERTGAWMANLNSPEQTVLSAPREALGSVAQAAQEAGARRVIPLNVAGAFHSPLMAPAAQGLAEVLAGVDLQPPRQPVYSNVTGRPHVDPAEIRKLMVEQVTGSVRWLDTVEHLRASGTDTYIEFGPGRVLTGLVKRIDRKASLHTINDPGGLSAAPGCDAHV